MTAAPSVVRALPLDAAALRCEELRRARLRRARQAQFRRRRAAVVLVLVLVVLGGVVAFGGGGTARATSSDGALPGPALASLVAGRRVVPGTASPLPWPTTGEAALAVLGSGLVARSPHQRVVPIASLTKMMTAYVLLHDHPLAPGQGGPTLEMTAADATAWVTDSQAGDSTVPVRAGEQLNEYQLLEALLIPSADNVAELLARWDAGSIPAFVARMNAQAQLLGLTDTHYADASGVDPGSRSTAADQAQLAAAVMEQPVVRDIVASPSRPFPVAGTIWNYNPGLGTDGIIGVKSGFTSEAQACLATAAYRDVGGTQVLVVTVALGQPGGLAGAAQSDETLLSAAGPSLVRVPVIPASGVVAVARFAWSPTLVALHAPELPSALVVWPGTVLSLRLERRVRRLASAARAAGTDLAFLAVRSSGGLRLDVPVVTTRRIPPVPPGWTPGG